MDSMLVVLASHLAQAIGSGVLAIVLVGFHRLYRRGYLLTWAWSCIALCVVLVAGTLALWLRQTGPSTGLLQPTLAALALAAGFCQLVWLISGTSQMANGRDTSQRAHALLLAALAVVAVAVVAGSAELPSSSRFFARVGLPSP